MTSNKTKVVVVVTAALLAILASLLIWGLFPSPTHESTTGPTVSAGTPAAPTPVPMPATKPVSKPATKPVNPVADPGGIPGLIARWKLDESDGIKAKDSSGLAESHDGTLVGNPAPASSNGRKGLDFNGGSQYVALGNIFQDGYAELSIACWMKHRSSSWQNIVERGKWDDADGIGLTMDFRGQSVDFGHYGVNQLQSKANVQDDQWHHVVGTLARSGSEYLYSLYVDGQLDNSLICPIGLEPSTQGWAIAARQDGTWGFQGQLSDVRIYNRALTAAEVKKLFKE